MLSRLFKRKPVQTYTVRVEHSGGVTDFCTPENKTLLESALQQSAPIPYSCQVGSCGECLCQITAGDIARLKDLSYMLEPEQLQKGYTLACQTYARSPITLRVGVGLSEQQPASITDVAFYGDELMVAQIHIAGQFAAKVGQYIAITNAEGVQRSYSIVRITSLPAHTELEIHIALKPDGRMSQWWREVAQSSITPTTITVNPAQGCYAPRYKQDIVAIASSSGLGVTAALVARHLAEHADQTATLIALTKPNEQSYLNWLRQQHFDTLENRVHVAQPCRDAYFSNPAQILAPFVGELSKKARCADSMPVGLICGSPRLISTTAEAFSQLGISRDRVSYDEFI
jgi:Ferredoxin